MKQIITISRQFGSGGRELGRRIADHLGIAYYDHEIVLELMKRTQMTEAYIQQVEESRAIPLLPITIGRTFTLPAGQMVEQSRSVFLGERDIILEMAERSDCVIVGRCADYILRQQNPFRIFVYADMDARITRCRLKGQDAQHITNKELQSQILSIDKRRARYYEFYTDQIWGDRNYYDLCLNTSHIDVKKAAKILAQFIQRD